MKCNLVEFDFKNVYLLFYLFYAMTFLLWSFSRALGIALVLLYHNLVEQKCAVQMHYA